MVDINIKEHYRSKKKIDVNLLLVHVLDYFTGWESGFLICRVLEQHVIWLYLTHMYDKQINILIVFI